MALYLGIDAGTQSLKALIYDAQARQVLAQAACDGLVLDDLSDAEAIAARLGAIPGVGPWTVGYVRMRVLKDPDAFIEGDLVVRHATQLAGRALLSRSEAWRPWRARWQVPPLP